MTSPSNKLPLRPCWLRLLRLSVAFTLIGCGGDPIAPSLASDASYTYDANTTLDASTEIFDAAPIDSAPPDLRLLCGAVPLTYADWEDCYRKRFCEWYVGCVPLGGYATVSECIEQEDVAAGGRISYERRQREWSVENGRTKVDYEAFVRCLAGTGEDFCRTSRSNADCVLRLRGTVPHNGECLSNVDCSSPGGICQRDCNDACCTGVCKAAAKLGEECFEEPFCEPELQCVDGICVSGALGKPCTSVVGCNDDGWCDMELQVCRSPLPEGSTCENFLQCEEKTRCIGLVSGQQKGRCEPVGQEGAPCDLGCLGSKLYCDRSVISGELGICREMPILGEACGGIRQCQRISQLCRDGRCAPRPTEGESCATGECAPGFFCLSEVEAAPPVCAPRREAGGACSRDAHCISYLCSASDGMGEVGQCQRSIDSCEVQP